jgi:hypothetical protein
MVWYILDQIVGELSEDANDVECPNDSTISLLRQKVFENNKNTLAGVDPSKLDVFEYGKIGGPGTKRLGQIKLSDCTSGSMDKPFRIFYKGIPLDSHL